MTGARRRGRQAALQMLYCWEVGRLQPRAAIDLWIAEHGSEAPAAVRRFAERLVEGVTARTGDLDQVIARHARHWRLERLSVIDRLILRLAVWELQHEADTPAAVVVDEAIELARRFSGEDAARFVNGVLDAAVKHPVGPPASAG